jgi:hypothetical protein
VTVARQIVVAFRMPLAGMSPGPEGTYLVRARSVCARGEALGGRLVAWSAALLAISWDTDSIEEAILLAVSIREESLSGERAWASGVAEGELEPLAQDGARMQLAWGEALLAAASLARIARPGEVCLDGDVRALRAGQLSLVGARSATDGGQRVRGWRLDLEHPWRRAPDSLAAPDDPPSGSALDGALLASFRREPEDGYASFPGEEHPPVSGEPTDPGSTQEMPVADFTSDELSTSDVIQMVEGIAEADAPVSQRRPGNLLADRVRRLARGDESADAIEALADLRAARARAEGAPPAARCQAALALAMTLAIAGRLEEALLEALDALARAREAQEPKAIGACTALLAKLYAGAGEAGEAAALRESSGLA